MSDEEAFQAALDANPDDFDTRGVFADWLEERGDNRAAGYRALWALRLRPSFGPVRNAPRWWLSNDSEPALESMKHREDWTHFGSLLPLDWFKGIESGDTFLCWRWWKTRREAEDAVALAFAKLPESRRAELLAQPATA